MNYLVIGTRPDDSRLVLSGPLSRAEAEASAAVFRQQLEDYDRIEVEEQRDGDSRAEQARAAQGPRFRLTLRALTSKLRSGEERGPVDNRLRFALKELLRRHGFRCERIEELTNEEAPP